MTDAERLDAIEQIVRSCASVVYLQEQAIDEPQHDLAQTQAELEAVLARSINRTTLAGEAPCTTRPTYRAVCQQGSP